MGSPEGAGPGVPGPVAGGGGFGPKPAEDGARAAEDEHRCRYCGGATREQTLDLAIWAGERLVVVRDVPARVCANCLEQFYDPRTSAALTELTVRGFPPEMAEGEMTVPVYSLPEIPERALHDSDITVAPADQEGLW